MRFLARLNERFGRAVRDGVLRDVAGGGAIGEPVGPATAGTAARLIAAAIVATPYLLAAAGLVCVAVGVRAIALIGVGGLLVLAAFTLRPRRSPAPAIALGRPEAPALFALLDRISIDLGAPRIDGIHVMAAFDAFVTQPVTASRILGIGVPLWLALRPGERLALLANEVAHLAGDDPARTRLSGTALATLSRWVDLVTPPRLVDHAGARVLVRDDRGVVAEIATTLLGGGIEAMALAYERLVYADSQRAEYLADLRSVRVAGGPAMRGLLDTIVLSPLAYRALGSLHVDGSRDVPVFEAMAEAARSPDPHQAARLRAEAAETLHGVDGSHPPTRFRLDVIGAARADAPRIDADAVDWARIDRELAPAFEAERQAVLARLLVQ